MTYFLLSVWTLLALTGQARTLDTLKKESDIDEFLKKRSERFRLKPIKAELFPPRANALFQLGKKLFHDNKISHSQKNSCASCHDSFTGQDNLEKSMGLDGVPLRRHTPHLFDIGRSQRRHFFWDGRVSYDPKHGAFLTPFEELNGPRSQAPWRDITLGISSALAMQSLFPLMSHKEMWGDEESARSMNLDQKRAWIEHAVFSKPHYSALLHIEGKQLLFISLGHKK